MSCAPAVANQILLFPYSKRSSELAALTRQYQDNGPFPHIRLSDFVDPEIAVAMAEEFPDSGTEAWTHYKHHNENKLGLAKRDLFPQHLGEVTDELNSPEFVSWLSELTGISGLVADPSLHGGGLHQSGRGGFLNVHTDFSNHHYHKNWRRRVNLILYLNPVWQDEWGGAIEFWEKSMRCCAAKYPPLFNHAVIFTTCAGSFHGFPDPLQCPENVSRKSLALYYYTVEPNLQSGGQSTDYRARPGDGLVESALIWLDKEAVDLYSRAKARFGFSDKLASKVLGLISREK
jgi:hypothetical protein